MKSIIILTFLLFTQTIASDDETKEADANDKSAQNENVTSQSTEAVTRQENTESYTVNVPVIEDVVTESGLERNAEESVSESGLEKNTEESVGESGLERNAEDSVGNNRVERSTPVDFELDNLDGQPSDLSTIADSTEIRTGDSENTSVTEAAVRSTEDEATARNANNEATERTSEKEGSVKTLKDEATVRKAEDIDVDIVRKSEKESDVGLKTADAYNAETDTKIAKENTEKEANVEITDYVKKLAHEETMERNGNSDISGFVDDSTLDESSISNKRRMLQPEILDTKARSASHVEADDNEHRKISNEEMSRRAIASHNVLDSRWQRAPPPLLQPLLTPQVIQPNIYYNQIKPVVRPFFYIPETVTPIREFIPEKGVQQNSFKINEFDYPTSNDNFPNSYPYQPLLTTPRPSPITIPYPSASRFNDVFYKLAQASEAPKPMEYYHQYSNLNRPPTYNFQNYIG